MSVSSKTRVKYRHAKRGITAISVRGYKSLMEEARIEIRPLTILAGANSSGKSSAIQPLLLLKQTLEATYDPGPLLIDGPNLRFTSGNQLLSMSKGRRVGGTFMVEVEIDGRSSVRNTYRKHVRRGFDLIEMAYNGTNEQFVLTPEMGHQQVLSIIPKELEKSRQIASEREKRSLLWKVMRTRCFLGFGFEPESRVVEEAHYSVYTPGVLFNQYIRGLIHVPGLRGNPARTYRATAVGRYFSGTFETYVASVINYWQSNEDRRLKALGDALEELGLTWKVAARQLDDVQVELRVGRLSHGARGGAMDLMNIADVGFGVSQTLPVLVALLSAQPGQLVYLEEPEIHLHPRAQHAMAKILIEAAKRGVRVVAETHSSLMLRSIQTHVAMKKELKGLVKLHWFARDADGFTKVSSANLDDKGSFGNWPSDFDDVNLEADKRYLDINSTNN
jgi:hypothetical protein